jgi:hypothetical protein
LMLLLACTGSPELKAQGSHSVHTAHWRWDASQSAEEHFVIEVSRSTRAPKALHCAEILGNGRYPGKDLVVLISQGDVS